MTSRPTRLFLLGGLVLPAFALGCGQGHRSEILAIDTDAGSGGADDGADDGEDDGPDPFDPSADDGSTKLDMGADEGDGTVGFGSQEECASFTASATIGKKPADIIFVVDNSPSMVEEADAVQARLNDFSEQIVDAGIDMRVLLLTAYPNPNVAPSIDTGICVEPPLGGGGCPSDDDNQPLFAHLHENIGSSHALQKIIDTQGVWAPMMRADSAKHIIVVSDDDSYLTADGFDAQFRAFDPSYEGYALHGIVSLSNCAASDTIGAEYIALAELTGGVLGDLCDQEFQPLFDTLTTAVLEGTNLACDWEMPVAPEGNEIDPESVEVLLEVDGAPLGPDHVVSADACAGVDHGWYYDDAEAPTRIVACPQTCTALQEASDATLDIEVGCAQPPVG
jgi:hypothetical protein